MKEFENTMTTIWVWFDGGNSASYSSSRPEPTKGWGVHALLVEAGKGAGFYYNKANEAFGIEQSDWVYM